MIINKRVLVRKMFTARVASLCLLIATFGFLYSAAQSIAKEKCREYGRLYETPDILFPSQPRKSVCNPRTILGEKTAKPGEFPYLAALKYITLRGEHRYSCSAALISEDYLITPAYCTLTVYGSPISARLGYFDIDDDNLGTYGQEINVLQLKPHPDYNKREHMHELALIRLERKVEFSKYIHPICLHDKEVATGEAMATGWRFVGKPHLEDEMQYKGKLLKNMYSVYAHDACADFYRGFNINIPKEQFCVGLKDNNCTWEPTGSLQLRSEDVPCMDSLVELNLYGPRTCTSPTVPDIYVKILPYIRWIETVVWE